MGTTMLLCVDNGQEQPPAEMQRVPLWFEEWEQVLSRFRFDSELSRLNRASGQPVAVSETLWQVFNAALDAKQLTGGLVTPVIGNSLIEIGYDRDFSALANQPASGVLSADYFPPPMESISYDDSTRTIYLPEGIRLDFGGVAKGWAAMQVTRRLERLGAVLMNCGGDISIGAKPLDGTPWEIGVHKPFDRAHGYAHMLYFDQPCGVATSATDRRRWVQGSALRHHIIDPQTGLPAETDILSATVVAPNAADAEAAAKSVLIRGCEDGLAWIESLPEFAALVILRNGRSYCSQRMAEFL